MSVERKSPPVTEALPPSGAPRLARAAWILGASSWMLRGALVFGAGTWMWSHGVLRFVSPWLAAGVWIATAALLVPVVARRAARLLERIPCAPWIAAPLAAALVLLLPDRTWFLGDFMLRQGAVLRGESSQMLQQAMPLDALIHFHGPVAIVRLFGVHANLVARLWGAFEIALLAWAAVSIARSLTSERWLRWVVATLILMGGYVTLFTGLGKAAGDLCVVSAAIAAFGLRALAGRGSLLPVALLLAVGLFTHRGALALLPACVLLGVMAPRATYGRRNLAALGVAAIALAVALPSSLRILRTIDAQAHWAGADPAATLAAAFAPLRVLDLVQLVLVYAPALPLAVPLAFAAPWRSRTMLFLASFAVGWLPIVLLAHPKQGLFRDWDAFGPFGVGLELIAAACIATALGKVGTMIEAPATRAPRDARSKGAARGAPPAAHPAELAAGIAALALAAGSSIAWLAHFADLDQGFARIRAFATEPPQRSTLDRGKAWEFIAYRNEGMGRPREAVAAYPHAAELVPHRYIYLSWITTAARIGDWQESHRAARALTTRLPEFPLGWYALAGVASQMGLDSEATAAAGRMSETIRTDEDRWNIILFRQTYGLYGPDSLVGTPAGS